MLNLIWKQYGKGDMSHLKQGQLMAEVKHYMIEAAEFALTREFSAEDAVLVSFYLQRIKDSDTTEEILEISNAGVEILIKYKPGYTGE
jgi:hypothetical protein